MKNEVMQKEKPKILYVEDDETLSFVTKDNLELNGYTVEHCMDGESALSTFQFGGSQRQDLGCS